MILKNNKLRLKSFLDIIIGVTLIVLFSFISPLTHSKNISSELLPFNSPV